MSKVTLSSVGDLTQVTTAQNTINNNSEAIQTAMDITLSRDGTSPNQMLSTLDMNSNRIINLPSPISMSEPVRLQDIADIQSGGVVFNSVPVGGLTGNVLAKLSNANYDIGWVAEGVNIPVAPITGRLTLVSGVPVTTSDVAGAVTLYFTPVTNNTVALYNGTSWSSFAFNEMSLNLDSNSGHTGYHQSGKIYDVFAFTDGSNIRIGTGPAWTNTTTRSAATAITTLNGFWVNNISMTIRYGNLTGDTFTVPANRGSYLGSFLATANGQTSDTVLKRYVYNVYNPAKRRMFVIESTPNWTYNTAAWRPVNASAANASAVLAGTSAGVLVELMYSTMAQGSTSGQTVVTSIGKDGISPDVVTTQVSSTGSANYLSMRHPYSDNAVLGLNTYTMLEFGPGTGSMAFYGSNSYTYMIGSVLM